MRRLVPAYVERPAWRLYDLVENLDPTTTDIDDMDALIDAARDLRAGLVRADALVHAPGFVLAQEMAP